MNPFSRVRPSDLLLHRFPVAHRSAAPAQRRPAGLVALREAAAVRRPQRATREGLCTSHEVSLLVRFIRQESCIEMWLNTFK